MVQKCNQYKVWGNETISLHAKEFILSFFESVENERTTYKQNTLEAANILIFTVKLIFLAMSNKILP